MALRQRQEKRKIKRDVDPGKHVYTWIVACMVVYAYTCVGMYMCNLEEEGYMLSAVVYLPQKSSFAKRVFLDKRRRRVKGGESIE